MKMRIILIILSFFFIEAAMAQKGDPKWDDTVNKNWSKQFELVDIKSPLDGEVQKVYIHFTKSDVPKPLIVSFHTWSGGYDQYDPLTKKILEEDWNYIHPDFRGVNNTPKACGSEFVISDIDCAISYALENANVDTTNIHVIGASGGGLATMLTYMKSKHNINTFSAWAGISDLGKWYYESLGRKNKYAGHISLVTTGEKTGIDLDDAKARSPYFMETPINKRKNSKFFLYCGVHDGYTGSVPISQTIDFYNKLVDDYEKHYTESKVPIDVREILLRQQNLPGVHIKEKMNDRAIHYQNSYDNKLFLCVFEGSHEMDIDVTVQHIPTKKSEFTFIENDKGIELLESNRKVLFYQKAPVSIIGKDATFNHYIHPLYALSGDTITEAQPTIDIGHFHHRGIFWAWHQIYAGDSCLGDSWIMKDIRFDIVNARPFIASNNAVIDLKVNWVTLKNNSEKVIVKEHTIVKVHPTESNRRIVDFEINLTAQLPSLKIAGSENKKGYGGFSTRIKLPENTIFRSINGEIEPEKFQINAGHWVDISQKDSLTNALSGLTIMVDSDNPKPNSQWILRRKNSMQNAVFPGQNMFELKQGNPLKLKYRLVIHENSDTSIEVINNWYIEYLSNIQ